MKLTLKAERPITQDEWDNQLHQKEFLNQEPTPSLSAIRMNSTYLEMVDGYYGKRGMLTTIGLAVIGVFVYFISILVYDGISDGFDSFSAFFPLILLLFSYGITRFLRFAGDGFGYYTHIPTRYNRKNRMVYVFREDGTILSVPWDEVLFTLAEENMTKFTRGLVLKDPQTVEEVFVMGYDSMKIEYCYRYWEFIRRYMEEGPEAVVPYLKICMPIADRRETFKQGYLRMNAEDSQFPLIAFITWPFNALFSLGRWVSMRTSKIPYWPKDIEEACAVEANDPYIRDSSQNMEGY